MATKASRFRPVGSPGRAPALAFRVKNWGMNERMQNRAGGGAGSVRCGAGPSLTLGLLSPGPAGRDVKCHVSDSPGEQSQPLRGRSRLALGSVCHSCGGRPPPVLCADVTRVNLPSVLSRSPSGRSDPRRHWGRSTPLDQGPGDREPRRGGGPRRAPAMGAGGGGHVAGHSARQAKARRWARCAAPFSLTRPSDLWPPDSGARTLCTKHLSKPFHGPRERATVTVWRLPRHGRWGPGAALGALQNRRADPSPRPPSPLLFWALAARRGQTWLLL